MPSELILVLGGFAIGLNAMVIATILVFFRGKPTAAKAAPSVVATIQKDGAFRRFRKWLKKDIKDMRREEQVQEQGEEVKTGSSEGMGDW